MAKIGGAGGAPVGDLLWASGVASVLSALVLWVAVSHRAGRITWLGRAAARAGTATGMPGWSVLPAGVATLSLLTAAFGFYWDVAKHIDTGRDAGPFGTAAHYPILVGLGGITLAGLLAVVLGTGEDDVPSAVRISEGWRAPLGGLLVLLCGGLALTGFPLDDVWHTLFGQDVTLWGPTHILMVGGASLSTLGTWILAIEGKRAGGGHPPAWTGALRERIARSGRLPVLPPALTPAAARRLAVRALEVLPARIIAREETFAAGGLLIGLSTLQGEFDYGVPQFQLVYQPLMIAFAAGMGLTVARLRAGRGAALGAAIFQSVVFGLMSLVIGPGFGLSTLHFPLYLVEALLVEGLFLLPAARGLTRSPTGIGAAAGLLCGTVGTAAEWGWSHVWMPLPWTASMLGQAALLAPAAGLAGGILGAHLAVALNAGAGDSPLPGFERGRTLLTRGDRASRVALPLAGLAIVICIAYPLPMNAGAPATATASLHTVTRAGDAEHRTVQGTFTLSPPSASDGAQWVQVIDWQGGALIVDRLRRVTRGVFATTQPIPVGGKWKAILRLENGRALRGVPIYLPSDPAIPARGVPASDHFTRAFEREKAILQREAVGGPAGLDTVAYALLALIVAGWLGAIVAGMVRMAHCAQVRQAPRPRRGGIGGRRLGMPAIGGRA